MIAYGTHELDKLHGRHLAKSNNLGLIGIESKTEINRPWDILELRPFKSFNIHLSEERMYEAAAPSMQLFLYTYNINPEKN